MAASAAGRRSSGPVLRSLSPSGRFSSSSMNHRRQAPASPSASAFASTVSSTFSPRSSSLFHRSASPTRVNLYVPSPPSASSSIRFSYDSRPSSPVGSASASASASSPRGHLIGQRQAGAAPVKKTCMCSPTNHPGSFRCSLHKNQHHGSSSSAAAAPYQSNRLNARRSAMTNSLVRIGTVEGDLVKRALAALIRPSSHQQKRRSVFEPRPSRLSVMSMAEETS